MMTTESYDRLRAEVASWSLIGTLNETSFKEMPFEQLKELHKALKQAGSYRQVSGKKQVRLYDPTPPCVYLCGEYDEGEVVSAKIGFSDQDPVMRVKGLQTGNSKPLKLLRTAHYYSADLAKNEEKRLHSIFDQYRTVGEWFSPQVISLFEFEHPVGTHRERKVVVW